MKKLQIKKGMRYSMQVAATIALGLAREAMANEIDDVLEAKKQCFASIVNIINKESGVDPDIYDSPYQALFHKASAIRFSDAMGGKVTQSLPPTLPLFLRADATCQVVGVSDIDGLAANNSKLTELLDTLLVQIEKETALNASLDRAVEHVFNELQKIQSLSGIMRLYPEAVNYMPEDMVEYVEAPKLIDLLKSA